MTISAAFPSSALHLSLPRRPRLLFPILTPHLSSPPSLSSSSFSSSSSSSSMARRFRGRGLLSGNFKFRAQVSGSGSDFPDAETDQLWGFGGEEVAVRSVVTVLLAVLNRVLYKLALVPMKDYPFFMAQITTFGLMGILFSAGESTMPLLVTASYHIVSESLLFCSYVAIYFSLLYWRYDSGIVTREMLGLPKSRFAAIGLLEALGVASGMAAAAMLPGPSIPILSQTFLVWQLVFSVIILDRRYSVNQILGCLLIALGVIVAVASGSTDEQMLSQVELLWPILMILSSGFQAAASIIKEFVFIDAAKRLEGKPLDIFVVNSFGSGFQALFVLLLLPLLSSLKGIPFGQLPSYLRDGAACFLNIGALGDCDGSPFLPLLYICINMAFNISILSLVKISSAVVSSLVVTLSVPISIFILSLPLPIVPHASPLSPLFIVGSGILVFGLILYNLPQPTKDKSRRE